MNEYLDKALEKLRGAKVPTGQREAVVFKPVVAALEDFCRQDAEFAQGVGGSLSDLEAYKRAAAFFFPGCVVTMKLSIAMCEHDVVPAAPQERKAVVLDLADFW